MEKYHQWSTSKLTNQVNGFRYDVHIIRNKKLFHKRLLTLYESSYITILCIN